MFIYLFNVICIYIFKKDQIYIECCKKIKFEGITWQRRIKTGSNKLGPFSEKRKLHLQLNLVITKASGNSILFVITDFRYSRLPCIRDEKKITGIRVETFIDDT